MLIHLTVLPQEDSKPYAVPKKGANSYHVRKEDGSEETLVVQVGLVIEDWGPSTVRIEGYAPAYHRRVIGYYHVNKIEDENFLGLIDIQET